MIKTVWYWMKTPPQEPRASSPAGSNTWHHTGRGGANGGGFWSEVTRGANPPRVAHDPPHSRLPSYIVQLTPGPPTASCPAPPFPFTLYPLLHWFQAAATASLLFTLVSVQRHPWYLVLIVAPLVVNKHCSGQYSVMMKISEKYWSGRVHYGDD